MFISLSRNVVKRKGDYMAKAALIMDMPKSCFGCNFLYCDGDTNLDSCQAREKARPVDSETYKKPDWCPLRELPVKKELYLSINSEKGYCVGWNACLGEILKTDELRKE